MYYTTIIAKQIEIRLVTCSLLLQNETYKRQTRMLSHIMKNDYNTIFLIQLTTITSKNTTHLRFGVKQTMTMNDIYM